MLFPRHSNPQHRRPGQTDGPRGRLNLLLSAGGSVSWRDESWADSLPRLLEPMGVQVWRVRSGREAADIIRSTPVHIALVDLALPLEPPCSGSNVDLASGMPPTTGSANPEEGGPRLLELLGRLATPPPTVVVKREKNKREDARTLCSVLEAGAFAVLERPVHLETALDVMRRILRRCYADRWPGGGA